MKKIGIPLLIILGSIVILFMIGRITGVLQMYNIPTQANEPSIKNGSVVWVSNLKEPKQFDFIVFKSNRQLGFDTTKTYTFIYRLVGLPGHVIEMRNGVLYIDNQNADAGLPLMHFYKVSLEYATSIDATEQLGVSDSPDSGYLSMTDETGNEDGCTTICLS